MAKCLVRRMTAFPTIEQDCDEQNAAAGDVLVKRIHVEQVHRVLHDTHNEDASDDEGHAPDAAGEGDAAEDTR